MLEQGWFPQELAEKSIYYSFRLNHKDDLVKQVVEANPDEAARYKEGKAINGILC